MVAGEGGAVWVDEEAVSNGFMIVVEDGKSGFFNVGEVWV